MSINCWLILQIDPREAGKASRLIDSDLADVDLDRAIFLYEGHRYPAFEQLSPADRSAALEVFVGDDLLRMIKDPRGICVHPEVGQSFDGLSYSEIAAESGSLFVTCESPALPAAADEKALFDSLFQGRTTSKVQPRRPQVPDDLTGYVLEGANVTYLAAGPGSRQFLREYPALRDEIFGDDFNDLFGRSVERDALGNPKNRIAVIQYKTSWTLADALPVIEGAFAADCLETELHKKKFSDVFAVSGVGATRRVYFRYALLSERGPAYVDMVRIDIA